MKKKVWFKQLGYNENPFSIKPGVYGDELEGYNEAIKKLKTGVKKGHVWFIQGPYGLGKTSILKNIINTFGGKGKLIYYSANRSEGGINFDQLLKGKSMFNKMFNVMPKDMILFMDEAQNMIRTDFEQIEELKKSGSIHSIIFVSDDISKVHFTNELRKRVGKNIINLNKFFALKNAEKMVKQRIGDNKFMGNDVIKHLYKVSKGNPRSMLENCEDLTKYVIDELEEMEIKIGHAKEFFEK